MTTDITELAQREKFEAWWERTQHNGNPPRFGWSHCAMGKAIRLTMTTQSLRECGPHGKRLALSW